VKISNDLSGRNIALRARGATVTAYDPMIFDGRNLYEPYSVKDQGLEYYPIGRK